MVVGDESSGKTDMLVQFCRGSIDSYLPSQFDSYNVPVTVDNVFIFLSIWDTAGTLAFFSPFKIESLLTIQPNLQIYRLSSLRQNETHCLPWHPRIHHLLLTLPRRKL